MAVLGPGILPGPITGAGKIVRAIGAEAIFRLSNIKVTRFSESRDTSAFITRETMDKMDTINMSGRAGEAGAGGTFAQPSYRIRRASITPELSGQWSGSAWCEAETGQINSYQLRSSDHRPNVQFKLLHDDRRVYVFFNVSDRYVRSTRTEWQSTVYRDSCVEFFVAPKPGKGYFNIEMNCGGAVLMYYIEDEREGPDGFRKFTKLPARARERLRIYHSMPSVVDPEVEEPVQWLIEYTLAVSLLEEYVGPLGNLSGQTWRGNFFKCADESSRPHWGAWSKTIEPGGFHQRAAFAPLYLD